ncbi:MAG TPA: glycosyltransferase [Streptosporangiaceae bacterium]|nr:glycosyltransferase [Streptosporangiaceae bacterium]
MLENEPVAARLPLLFLVADTGGGHRNAARAVGQALERMYPGRFAPVLCDPLGGPGSARLLRFVAGLYGPATRLAPWLWRAAYRACDSRPAMRVLQSVLLRLANRPAADAAKAHGPAAVVSFHPLTGSAAVAARSLGAPGAPVVTVVTDLARMHTAWRHARADAIIAPPHPGRGGWIAAGLPVTREFWGGPLCDGERAILRRSLGLREKTFLVLVTGGGEGSGGIAARTAAILRRFPDVDVVTVCGRNKRLKRRLDRLAASPGSGERLTVTGFTRHMADWLRACDLVVTKAGPGTIAEATCCGAPLLLTSHLPGQETGNAEIVTRAGAGRRARSVRRLLAEVDGLRADRERTHAMRAASARLGQPAAAADIAAVIARLVMAAPPPAASRSYAKALGYEKAGARPGAGIMGAAQAGEAGA